MEKDYYSILGVERSATKDDIKKAFHKLAKKYHPDNKSTGNEERFKEINEAYQMLSDDKKRSEYDTYGHVFTGAGGHGNASGFDPFSGFGGGGAGGVEFDLGDIFGDFFGGGAGGARGGARSRRGRDISIDLEISFAESVFGVQRNILLTKTSACSTCKGSGAKEDSGFSKCTACNGQGKIRESRSAFFGTFTSVRECAPCKGEGKVPKEKCVACKGLGVERKQEEISVTIPPGIENGEVIRLGGMGEAIARGVAGDLYAKIHVISHPVFRRDGDNLVMDLHLKLTDALLGKEHEITLLDNSTIKLKVPPGVSFGETLRVRGKGVPIDRGRQGDLLVKLNIKFPKNLSEKARKLFEELKNEGI